MILVRWFLFMWVKPFQVAILVPGLHNLLHPCIQNARKWRENEENGERMRKWKEIHSLHFLTFSLFPPSLSISYIKNCHILSQNVKYGTFVANVTKNLTYALWGNNSGSNSLRGSSASCASLDMYIVISILEGRRRSRSPAKHILPTWPGKRNPYPYLYSYPELQ